MPVRLTLDGFDEFAQSLAALPTTLKTQAEAPVRTAAEATEAQLLAGYPEKSGHMRAGVKQITDAGTEHFAIVVASTAPEAHLWEYGTKVRHTQKGWNRGSEQGARDRSLHVIADAHQIALNGALAALLRDAGFEVGE